MGWQDEIQPKTQEFLAQFGENFLKSFGVCLFLKIKAEVEADQTEETRKLNYRDWHSVIRPHLRSTSCWIKEGDGAGAFGGWSGLHVVEQQDYNVAVYKDEKASKAKGQKPKFLIKMAGYALEKNVTDFYAEQAKQLAAELECDPPETAFSQYSWALAHPIRTNYILQLHKGAGGGCACFGGSSVEPMDAGFENADKMEEWQSWMDEFIQLSSPRDLESDTVAMAFERTVQKMSQKIPELDGFSDDGTEAEILNHMIFIAVFEASCKSELQEEVKKSPIARMSVWYKGRAAAAAAISKAVEPAWSSMQKKATELAEKIEPKIRDGLEPILAKKMELTDKLKSQVGGKIGELISAKITPILSPLIDAFDKPMRKGVKSVQQIFNEEVAKELKDGMESTGKLPQPYCNVLDGLARDENKVESLYEAAADLVQPLEALKSQQEAKEILENLDPNSVRKDCLQSMLELLDAACYTTELLMEANCLKLSEVLEKVNSALKEDGENALKETIRSVLVSLLLGVLASLTKEYVEPVIDSVKDVIPEDLQEILDVESEYSLLLEATIGEAVGKIIDAKYK